jgi:uncharacterized protein with HEPN domain
MLDAAREAIFLAHNRSRQDLDTDLSLRRSLVKSIEIIGEAASKVTKDCRNKFPQISWGSIISMRNRLIHMYYDINLNTVWHAVTQDIPPLIAELEKAIAFEEER